MTFAKQGPGKEDDAARPGNGFVDVFAPNGDLLQRLVSRGELDSPWAVTLAPSTFGTFGGDILVGNFGNGRINAYDPTSGELQGKLSSSHGGPIATPEDAAYINEHTDAVGFVGASSLERLGVEDSLTQLTRRFKKIPLRKEAWKAIHWR